VHTLPLARSVVDPAAHRRAEPHLLDELWADPRTLVLVVHEGRLPLTADGARLDLRAPSRLHGLAPGEGDAVRVFLGQCDEGAYLAVLLADLPAEPGALEGVPAPADDVGAWLARVRWGRLRDVGHALGDRDADLATTAVALAEWHGRHPRCARCGAPTRPGQAGWVRRCPEDGSEDYPRTDAAVIMAVTDDDGRILLAHGAHWPPHRYSTLAGFVEPGESLETAVRREVAEETGVVVDEVTYVASQPWPFPASLMLGFRAHATTTEVTVDAHEVTDARWFTRDGLTAALSAGEVLLPMRTSIALALIEDWFGGTLPATALPATG
jgi:NAD+ diphosphatase